MSRKVYFHIDLSFVVVVFAVFSMFALPVQARVQRLSLENLKEKSLHIVVADVVGKAISYKQAGAVWTDYRLLVKQAFKGNKEQNMVISFAGADQEGVTSGVLNLPVLEVGSTYLLFLHPASKHYASATVGWQQGIFQQLIVDGREMFVSPDGEPLVIGQDGSLQRGAPGEVVNGEFVPYSSSKNQSRGEKADEPLITDWQGEIIDQPRVQATEPLAQTSPDEYADYHDVVEFFSGNADEAIPE